jgi:hypothetical protein
MFAYVAPELIHDMQEIAEQVEQRLDALQADLVAFAESL